MRARGFYGEACQLPLAVAFYALCAKFAQLATLRARVVVNNSARPNSVDMTLGAGADTCSSGGDTLQRCPERRRGLEGIAATLDNLGKSRLWSASLKILRGHVFAPLSLRDDAVHSRT
jgi:hypothetical protein